MQIPIFLKLYKVHNLHYLYRRVTKVVKGGRRFGFSTFAVVGDGKGSVGCGLGKALEISESAKKAVAIASKDMKSYSYFKNTIPHEVVVFL